MNNMRRIIPAVLILLAGCTAPQSNTVEEAVFPVNVYHLIGLGFSSRNACIQAIY